MGYLYEACDQIPDLCHQQLLRKMCIYVQCVQKPTKSANRKQESDGSKNNTHNMVYLYDACDQISDFCHQQLLRKMRQKISWTDGRTEVKQYTPSPFGERGYKNKMDTSIKSGRVKLVLQAQTSPEEQCKDLINTFTEEIFSI